MIARKNPNDLQRCEFYCNMLLNQSIQSLPLLGQDAPAVEAIKMEEENT
jgi:hypothetical protein